MNNLVYKYFPADRRTYFEDELLRFTQPGYLNDPFECLPSKGTDIEIINAVRNSGKEEFKNLSDKEILFVRDHHSKDFLKKRNERFGILSLTARWNSTLMWSHYSNRHSGFCIGFNRNDPYFLKTLPNGIYKRVRYSSKRVEPLLEDSNDLEFAFVKSEEWSYEREERLVQPLFLKDKEIVNENNEKIFLFKVPHDLIWEIIIGVNAAESLTNEIIKFGKMRNIQLYKCKISDTKFDMEREKL